MANVIWRSRYARKSRGADLSMISFDGVDQYASAGVNQNVIQAVNFNTAFSISFFVYFSSIKSWIISCNRFDATNSTTGGINMNNGWVSYVANNKLYFELRRKTGLEGTNFQRDIIETPIQSDGAIKYITVTSDGIALKLSTNSVLVATKNIIQVTQDVYAGGSIPPLVLSGYERLNDGQRLDNLQGGISYLSFYDRALTEKEIIYEHQNAKPHPDTNLNVVARYEPGKNGHTILDKVQDYNPTLTPYNASLINYTDAEVGIPDQSTNTAYKDFHTKQNIVSL